MIAAWDTVFRWLQCDHHVRWKIWRRPGAVALINSNHRRELVKHNSDRLKGVGRESIFYQTLTTLKTTKVNVKTNWTTCPSLTLRLPLILKLNLTFTKRSFSAHPESKFKLRILKSKNKKTKL